MEFAKWLQAFSAPVVPAVSDASAVLTESVLTERVRDALLAGDWKFEHSPDGKLFVIGCRGEHARWHMYIQIDARSELIHVYSEFDFLVPIDSRLAVAECITRINHAIQLGHFELNFNDGEVRFVGVLDALRDCADAKRLYRMADWSMVAMDRHFPALVKVAYAGVEPEVALAVMSSSLGRI